MTDKAVQKEEIKKHVRALLLSSPMPLTVGELKRDFHSFIGQPLAFREMGYTTVTGYIFRDISDAVHIGWKNGMMTLSAKADESTKHIERLVSKQRIDRKKKYAVMRGGRMGGGPRQWQAPSRSITSHYNQKQGPPPPMVPSYIRGQVKDMFKSFPEGLPLTHFDMAFTRRFGVHINFKYYGYATLFEMLSVLTDICSLKMQGGEWRVISTQVSIPRFTNVAPAKISRQESVEYVPPPRQETVGPSGAANNTSKRPSRGRGRRRHYSGSSGSNSQPNDGEKIGEAPGSPTSSADTGKFMDDVTDRLQQEIRRVLERRPAGVWASRLPYEYSDLHGKALDFREQGYLSVIDFIASLPSIARIERPTPQGDWMLYDARIPKPAAPARSESTKRSRHTSGQTVEVHTREAIQRVLRHKIKGIPVNDFPAIFEEMTGTKLPVEELGFTNPDSLLLSLADSILQLAYRGNGVLMLFPINCDIPDLDETPVVEPPPQPVDVAASDRPDDCVGPGCHYTPILVPEAGGYLGIFVSNIVNPGLFWVQLRKKSASLALENLMDELDHYYCHDSSKQYCMPESLIKRGQVCATLFPEDQNWHRGMVTGFNKEGFVEVYYVDYGNTNFVDKSTIRFLKTEFLQLPAQAIQGRLANIKPKDAKWKMASRTRLLRLCTNKPLIAYITAAKDQVLSVCLTDTNSKEDVHINDLLVSEGYAIFSPDDEATILTGPVGHKEVPDYGCVYGWTSFREAPRLPKAASPDTLSDTQSIQDKQDRKCYVKWIQLTKDHIIHLINLNQTAYVVSAEVSSLLWEEDILSSMLKMKGLDAKKLTVSSDDYPDLFEDLQTYNVKSLRAAHHISKQFISLYTLNSVPAILRAFKHKSTELIEAVEEFTKRFDPTGPYWKQAGDVEPSKEEVEEADDVELSREEQQIALHALQFKRKRILQKLMSEPTEDTVNELNQCEEEITVLKLHLDQMLPHDTGSMSRVKPVTKTDVKQKASQPAGSQYSDADQSAPDTARRKVEVSPSIAGPVPGTDQSAATQKVIQDIFAATTKPIATANIIQSPRTSLPGTSGCQPTGSHYGMMGVQNLNFAQQQRFINPLLLAQSQVSNQAPDVQNTPTLASLGAQLSSGLLPAVNPMLNPAMLQNLQNIQSLQLRGMMNPNISGAGVSTPALGRGQTLQSNSGNAVPGLLPMFQHMVLGRGRPGSNPGNSDK